MPRRVSVKTASRFNIDEADPETEEPAIGDGDNEGHDSKKRRGGNVVLTCAMCTETSLGLKFPKQLVCKGFSIFLKAGKWESAGENGRPRIGRPALCGQAKREGRPRKAKDFFSPCFGKSTPARTGRTPA